MKNKFLYQKIYGDMSEKILNGIWAKETLIPKESDLLDIYDVSRDTLRKALGKLKNEGLIYTKSGMGTYVKDNKVHYKLSFIESFSEMVRREGRSPRSIVYQAKKITPDETLREIFHLNNGEPICAIERLRLSGDKILCFEKTYVNSALCKNIEEYITPNVSLFELYEKKYNLKIGYGKYSLEAINSSEKMANILGIQGGDALLLMNALVFTEDHSPIFKVEAYYIGTEYIFSTTLLRN